MRTLRSPELRRNMGFWDEATQEAILNTEVAIAGNGGTGNLFGMELARIGVQRFRIADPEVFDDVNSNRVFGARTETIGRNKAAVLKEDILAINPEADITVYEDGITLDNIDDFLQSADIALNGTELTMPQLGTMLARSARTRHINGELRPLPVLDVEYIGHAGQGTSFIPGGVTFEKFMGLKIDANAPLKDAFEQAESQTIPPSRYLAYLPSYGDLKTLEAVQKGAPLPSNMIGAGQAATIGVAEVLKHVRSQAGLRGRKPVVAPRVIWHDAYLNESGETAHPQVSYYRTLARVVFNNLLHHNEPASYTDIERALRGDLPEAL